MARLGFFLLELRDFFLEIVHGLHQLIFHVKMHAQGKRKQEEHDRKHNNERTQIALTSVSAKLVSAILLIPPVEYQVTPIFGK